MLKDCYQLRDAALYELAVVEEAFDKCSAYLAEKQKEIIEIKKTTRITQQLLDQCNAALTQCWHSKAPLFPRDLSGTDIAPALSLCCEGLSKDNKTYVNLAAQVEQCWQKGFHEQIEKDSQQVRILQDNKLRIEYDLNHCTKELDECRNPSTSLGNRRKHTKF